MSRIELIVGPMFSGKTEVVITRLRQAAKRGAVVAFKPAIDTRDSPSELVSHSGATHRALSIAGLQALRENIGEARTICVDEAQFFAVDLVRELQELRGLDREIVVAGLDRDFRGQPFPSVEALAAVADTVTRVRAICARCGNPADFSQRLIEGRPAPPDSPVIMIGASGLYEPRCQDCFVGP